MLRRYLVLGAFLALSCAGPVAAQAPSFLDLSGAWSTQRPAPQGGMERFTDLSRPDGSCVSVQQLPNGPIERAWGRYQEEPIGPGRVRMVYQLQGWLPRWICAQSPGFPVRCQPYRMQATRISVFTATSASAFQVNGLTVRRDPAPFLLRAPVPERLLLAVAAPVQPMMRQPVMPTLHPYQTPNGPGEAISRANHANAQDFINLNMRGCSKDNQGRLYNCQQ